MNQLIKFLLLSLLSFSFIKCNPSKEQIVVNQKGTKKSVILRLTLKDSSVFGVQFSNKLELENNSLFVESFIAVDYMYNDSLTDWRNLGIELYKIDNQKLNRISNNKKKILLGKSSLEYIYYTRHFVDSAKTTQQQFKSYIEKMLAEEKDTLHIGTVAEFKKRHKALFEKLTKGDSLSIQFLDGKKLGERITVPVEW